ncbi:MAG TPA: sensor histidine kinase [Candidatus Binatia bacterium]|jgi:signal transduction histidine kinase|nr:sensor histidine kinase [Candidatus Binatia bacterium]
MIPLLESLEHASRRSLVLAGLAALALIGLVDYLTGFEIMFSVFYLLEVGLAAWFLGKGFGLLMAVLSVIVWIGGDIKAGALAHYSSPLIPIWNALILLVLYVIIVWLLTSLRSLHRDLEARVQQRTQALQQEMAQRQRLEEEILQISEREQRRIGHDLHDSLCQHLTATALAGQVLAERLAAKLLPEAADAGNVVRLVEEGMTLARSLARGLYPVEMDAEGLMAAFQELANNITKGAKVRCVFECDSPVLIHNDAAATHLYRIAQEAVRNAIRHGKPKRIGINLAERDGRILLTVEDDGVGLPETEDEAQGLGIRIMAHRAAMIGGSFAIEPAPAGGTIVTCAFPPIPAPAPATRP